MSTAQERIESDLKTAMKERDPGRVATLRMLLSAIKNRRIELHDEVSDDELIQIVRKQIKQREDSIRQYREGGREELADREQAEIDILAPYLPVQASEEEIRAAVEAFVEQERLEGPKGIGPVMKAMMAKFGPAADGAVISRVAKDVLGS